MLEEFQFSHILRESPVIGEKHFRMPKDMNSDVIFAIRLFMERMAKVPHYDLRLFKYNIRNIELQQLKKLSPREGAYNFRFNKLKLGKDFSLDAVLHELFHVSSTYYKKGIVYSGFLQIIYIPIWMMGEGLMEGYTEILKKRYFGDYNISNPYFIETVFASFLEHIIGRIKMEELYSKADLKGLILEMMRYNNIESIFRFIRKLSFILGYENDPNVTMEINADVKYCYDFIIECYINKLDEMYKDKLIDKEAYKRRLKKFSSSLIRKIKLSERFKNLRGIELEEYPKLILSKEKKSKVLL